MVRFLAIGNKQARRGRKVFYFIASKLAISEICWPRSAGVRVFGRAGQWRLKEMEI